MTEKEKGMTGKRDADTVSVSFRFGEGNQIETVVGGHWTITKMIAALDMMAYLLGFNLKRGSKGNALEAWKEKILPSLETNVVKGVFDAEHGGSLGGVSLSVGCPKPDGGGKAVGGQK